MRLDPELERQLAAVAADEGLELLAVEQLGSGRKLILRLVVDSPVGVTLDQCAEVSRQASAVLDVSDPIAHTYTLEVSSPGLDRKLYDEGDYQRFQGERVKVRMQPSYRHPRIAVGELLGLEGDVVKLRTDGGEIAELPFDQVFETRLDVDWNAIMKEGKRRT